MPINTPLKLLQTCEQWKQPRDPGCLGCIGEYTTPVMWGVYYVFVRPSLHANNLSQIWTQLMGLHWRQSKGRPTTENEGHVWLFKRHSSSIDYSIVSKNGVYRIYDHRHVALPRFIPCIMPRIIPTNHTTNLTTNHTYCFEAMFWGIRGIILRIIPPKHNLPCNTLSRHRGALRNSRTNR